MRNSIWTALLALAVLFALVWLKLLLTGGAPEAQPAPVQTPDASSGGTRLRVLVDGEVRDMALEDYVVGVTAAEMPADFLPEALRAQAVAARTYALYCARGGKHADADVCTDPGCCQAWLDEAALRERWGEDFDARHEKIAAAAEATAGERLCYEGQAVFAAFHSSSAGFTEDCGAIWSELPYLKSVFSPETAERVPNYVTFVARSALDFRDTLLYARPTAELSGPPETWLGETERDESGRTAFVVLGGERFSGTELRGLFSLRSTAFTLTYEDGEFVFTVTGFGHGVGMSQYGAEVMAEAGADYREILAHYYPGTELVKEFGE
ncbi:MAG: stage II sporulation protein D [Oscillospiraceae bacterium]|nr:stage II sporulation protein D [Oscillospiraceae bacterium]